MTDNNNLPVLFALGKVTVNLAGVTVLQDFSLQIRQGEAVAVTGASGSGKTVLAQTIAGRHFFRGHFSVADGNVENFQRDVQIVEQQHRFRNRNQTADQYYQQRFNSLNATETITVAEDLEPYGEGGGAFSKQRLVKFFGVASLLPEPLIQLSNGENKRLQMVKALLLPTRRSARALAEAFLRVSGGKS